MAIKWPEIQYKEEENGMLEPMIEFPKQPEGSIGKYGEMRRQYMMEWRKATYQLMILNGTLKKHLMEINELAYQMENQQIQRLLSRNPAPSKASDQLGWVQHMNSLKAQAEEIVLSELIYV